MILVVVAGMAIYHQRSSQRSKVGTVREATKAVPFSPNYGLAWLSNAMAENHVAKKLLDKHLRDHPDDPHGYYQRGVAELGGFDYESAAADFQRSLDLEPNQPRAWNNLSYALSECYRFEEALTAADQAIQREPEYARAHGSRAYALLGLGRNLEALSSFDRALELDPRDNLSAWGRHEVFLREAMAAESEAAAQRAAAIGPQPWTDWPTPAGGDGLEQ